MVNKKVLLAAEEHRKARAAHAARVHQGYACQVKDLIAQLSSPSQSEKDRAARLLSQMNFLIVPELLDALADHNLEKPALAEILSLLGAAGNSRACDSLWNCFQEQQGDPQIASIAALSLAKLGDQRVLPFVRLESGCEQPERVYNAVHSLNFIGAMEDIYLLRAIYRKHNQHKDYDRRIRLGVVHSIKAIMDEMDSHTAYRILDQIRSSFADRSLWRDLSY